MRCKQRFHELALAEWKKLDGSIKEPLKKKLTERLETPRVTADALSGFKDCYKIKLRRMGFRLVYRVDNNVVYVAVIALGKCDKSAVYGAVKNRL